MLRSLSSEVGVCTQVWSSAGQGCHKSHPCWVMTLGTKSLGWWKFMPKPPARLTPCTTVALRLRANAALQTGTVRYGANPGSHPAPPARRPGLHSPRLPPPRVQGPGGWAAALLMAGSCSESWQLPSWPCFWRVCGHAAPGSAGNQILRSLETLGLLCMVWGLPYPSPGVQPQHCSRLANRSRLLSSS